jgi:hypothetical protein
LKRHAVLHQHARQVLRAVDAVVVDHLRDVEVGAHAEQFLRVPDEDRQPRAAKGRQGKLAGGIGQADHHQGIDASRFELLHNRFNAFSRENGAIKQYVRDWCQLRQHGLAKPPLASFTQFRQELLVKLQRQGQESDPRLGWHGCHKIRRRFALFIDLCIERDAGAHAEGVQLHSPGSRSAPWDAEAAPRAHPNGVLRTCYTPLGCGFFL